MWSPFESILSTAHCAVTRELTSGRGIGDTVETRLSCDQWPASHACHQSWHPGRGLCPLYYRTRGMQVALAENFRKPRSFFQVKFPRHCSSMNQARAHSALFSSFQREMVCWRVIPQHSFISFSCWDVLARSSPLLYWFQTICDCGGLWLLS